MANRPIFVPISDGNRFVREVTVEFEWNPGMAPSQKRRNIVAIHEAAAKIGISPVLEISTKSMQRLGESLSAFNLPIELDDGTLIPLECAFQGGKIFSNGGPYTDIYSMTSREAKKDERLRSSGSIVGFKFEGFEFPIEPRTAFYDWLYLRALSTHKEHLDALGRFAAFSDVEFNPGKSINCQARSCALFVSMERKGILGDVLRSPSEFIAAVAEDSLAQPHSDDLRQGRLF